ncbi:hypothetical protein CYY_006160 [Polysphondylium violaceum]|uniref:DUF4286 family protein n=1 Tax=Polysphondylium violaceum TaxID=133409 RepID=A0A8J4PSD1_9MYCE|nr:hypothetical protein CYY_006160 [Polysphondylium violaceum]
MDGPKASQLIYEVSVQVDKKIVVEWEKWIVEHINQIVSLDNGTLFSKGHLCKLDQSFDSANETDCSHIGFVIHYYSNSKQCLNTYFDKHAPLLRKDGLDRFGDQFKATRRVFVIEKEITAPPPQSSSFGYVF